MVFQTHQMVWRPLILSCSSERGVFDYLTARIGHDRQRGLHDDASHSGLLHLGRNRSAPRPKTSAMESDRRAWLEAFHAQLTKQLIANAEHYAASRALGVRRAGGNVDDLYGRELVQDVLTDTLSGVLAWKPSRCTLETHVLDGVRFRSRHDRERARRFQHISLESCDEPTRAMIEDALATATAAQQTEDTQRHARCLESIRCAAEGDCDLVALLDAYRRARSKEDVLEATGLSPRQYDNARKRLARLVRAERRRELKRA